MLTIFNPWVHFVGQDRHTLCLMNRRQEVYHRIENLTAFDFKRLETGVEEKEIPPDISTLLRQFGYVDTSVSITSENKPVELQFLETLVQSREDIKSFLQNLKNARGYILDLAGAGKKWFDFTSFGPQIMYGSDVGELEKVAAENNFFVCVIVESYDNPLLTVINELLLKKKVNWILVKNDFQGVLYGPFFSNEMTRFCFDCFYRRITSKYEKRPTPSLPLKQMSSEDLSKQAELSWLKFQLVKDMACGFLNIQSFVLEFDVVLGNLKRHPFTPYPICQVCKP